MSILHEIKQRKVFKVAAVYAVVAWLLIQIITSVEEPLKLPEWADSFVIVLLALGFPVAVILSWAFDITPEGIKPAPRTYKPGISPHSRVVTFTFVSQVLVLLAIAFLMVNQFMNAPGDNGSSRTAVTDLIRYNYRFPDGEALVPTPGTSIAVSADGSRIAYLGPAESGRQLWIRERDQLQSTPLPGSADAVQPFFAPDGSEVAYITLERQIKVISRIGDPPLTIVDRGVVRVGADWGVDGYVYYSNPSGLVRQAANGGGNPESVTTAKPEGAVVIYHGWPNVLPNGRGVIFTIMRDHLADEIAVVDLSTNQVYVLAVGTLGKYAASGHLVYVRDDGSLMAVPFDQEKLSTNGPEVRLSDQLPPGSGQDLAISRTGRLLYTRSNATWEPVWVDRKGNWAPVNPDDPMRGVRYVSLSPDDTMLALSTFRVPGRDDGQVWIKHLPNGPFAQFTLKGEVNMRPSWSPDGQSIAFISDRGENRDAWIKRLDGISEAEVLLDDPKVVDEAFFSSNSDWLVYRRGKEDGDRDIFAIRSGAESVPVALADSEFNEVAPALSVDSRWLAYVSDRGEKANVYIRPFPNADREFLVSVNGGTEPKWSRTGSELYYRNGAGEMVVVPVLPGEDFRTGPEQVLFSANAFKQDFYHAAYDISADDQLFVMIRTSESGQLAEELIVVENVFDELRRLVPTN